MNERIPTVFVVDDEGSVREGLDSFLRAAGFHVQLFCSASEFLLAWQPDNFGCLILDVQLRGGSGFRLLKQMRAARIDRPELVIVVTNYPSEDYRNASHACGADHFFDKASEFDKVREVLIGWGSRQTSAVY